MKDSSLVIELRKFLSLKPKFDEYYQHELSCREQEELKLTESDKSNSESASTSSVQLPRVMDVKDLISTLNHLGFNLYTYRSSHEKYVNSTTGQRVVISTHKKVVHVALLNDYLRQSGIDKSKFMETYLGVC